MQWFSKENALARRRRQAHGSVSEWGFQAPGGQGVWPCRWLCTYRQSGDPRQHRVIEFSLQWKRILLLNVLVTPQNVHIHPLEDEFHICHMMHRQALWLSVSRWDQVPFVCSAGPVSCRTQPGQTHTLPPP